MLKPKRIIHNRLATIVFWNDNTKTVVKCSENDEPDNYTAFCAAYCKKVFGNNSHLKRVIKDAENGKPEKHVVSKLRPTGSLSASKVSHIIGDFEKYMKKICEAEILKPSKLYVSQEPEFSNQHYLSNPMPGCKSCEAVSSCPDCITSNAIYCKLQCIP